jgi:hypothetical protein
MNYWYYLIIFVAVIAVLAIIYYIFNNTLMAINQRLSIIVFLVIGIIIFCYLTYVTKSTVSTTTVPGGTAVQSDAVSGMIPTIIKELPIDPVLQTSPLNYTFNLWVFINNWNVNYDKEKMVLITPTLKISLGKVNPSIKIITNDNKINVGNIPLQKWVNLCVVVRSNEVDIYINGKLRISHILDKVPMLLTSASSTNSIGFGGLISQVLVYPKPLIPSEIYTIYKTGYSGNTITSTMGNTQITINTTDNYSTKSNAYQKCNIN